GAGGSPDLWRRSSGPGAGVLHTGRVGGNPGAVRPRRKIGALGCVGPLSLFFVTHSASHERPPVPDTVREEPILSAAITPAPTITLRNGVQMPRLGLGTWPMTDAEAERAVASALNLGYRLIDTAENYRNETGVGAGIRQSGVSRDQVFVTTKF